MPLPEDNEKVQTVANNEPNVQNFISYDKAVKLIPCFDGDTSLLHNFIDSVEFVFKRFDPADLEIFQFVVKSKLQGAALNHISTFETNTWKDIIS